MSDNAENPASDPVGVELSFPIEFAVIDEVPISQSGSAQSRARWKATVEAAARAVIDPSSWATDQPVSITILYFPDGRMQGDIDNIVKPILDALIPFIYMDDSQVERVWAQKFEPDRPIPLLIAENPTAALSSILDAEPPALYIRIDNDVSLGT